MSFEFSTTIWEVISAWTPLEALANFFTVLSIWLAGRNSIQTWWTGILAAILFGILFYQIPLYADTQLQLFFVVTSFIGCYNWRTVNGAVTPITKSSKTDLAKYSLLSITTIIVYGFILHYYTNDFKPWADVSILVGSVFATFLLMARKIENWVVWIVVNTISVPTYWVAGLYLTSILYAVFFVHAFYGWYNWHREMTSSHETI